MCNREQPAETGLSPGKATANLVLRERPGSRKDFRLLQDGERRFFLLVWRVAVPFLAREDAKSSRLRHIIAL